MILIFLQVTVLSRELAKPIRLRAYHHPSSRLASGSGDSPALMGRIRGMILLPKGRWSVPFIPYFQLFPTIQDELAIIISYTACTYDVHTRDAVVRMIAPLKRAAMRLTRSACSVE